MFSQIKQFLLGLDSRENLPRHVEAAIKSQQLASEKLVSWFLFILIALMLGLFLSIPAMEPSGHHTMAVVICFFISFSFAIIRITLVNLKYMPEWFLVFSSLFDVLLLMILVWALHIFFNMPPAFSLKVPVLNYIYILLALRTLRFEGQYVLLVGFSALISYFILFYTAIQFSPVGTVTRDYTKYVTGEYIYIPGEINKMLIMLIVTVCLFLAVTRGRRLLVRAITETRSTSELSRFFEPALVSDIIDSHDGIEPGHGRICEAAILYCDIRGFTPISKRLSPNDLMGLLTEYQSIIVESALAHHGSIDKFMGDGLLITFNSLTRHANTYAGDALRAAIAMSKANKEWQARRIKAGLESLSLAISIAIGRVTVGVVGVMSRLEYTTIGEPVNVSAKLNKYCKIENCEILMMKNAYVMAIKQGFNFPHQTRLSEDRKIEGIQQAVDLVVIESL